MNKTCVAFGFRHFLYNVNTVNLQQLIQAGHLFVVMQIEPLIDGISSQGYRDWAAAAFKNGCALLTSDLTTGEIPPTIDREMMRQAAVASGFVPAQQRTIPDGQTVTLWEHPDQ